MLKTPLGFTKTPFGLNKTPLGFSNTPFWFSKTPFWFSKTPFWFSKTPFWFSRTTLSTGLSTVLERAPRHVLGHGARAHAWAWRRGVPTFSPHTYAGTV